MAENVTWEEAVLWLKSQKEFEDIVKYCYFDDSIIESAKRFYQSSEWKAVSEILADKKGHVLDIGAGRGISSYAFATDGWKVAALEPDKSIIVGSGAIKQIKAETNLDITIIESYAEELPFNDKTFDLVYARQAMHHARNLDIFCSEIYRVLKLEGIYFSSRDHVLTRKEDLRIFLNNHPLHNKYGGENAYTLDEYKTAIKNSGLKIKKIFAPYDSDINLFPDSRENLKKQVSSKLRFSVPELIFNLFISWYNFKDNVPGRLYSFVCYKPI